MRRSLCLLLFFCLIPLLPVSAQEKKPAKPAKASAKTLPVTTSSPKARELFDAAMADFENVRTERALKNWRAAAQADPNFALAHALIAYRSRNPVEQSAARARARSLAAHVTPGERLLIDWVTNLQENKYVAGIAAMNDLVAMFPKDKRVLLLAGGWLLAQNAYEPAKKIFERALALDKNYPAALNDLGYVHAYTWEFHQALDAMERYVKALPGEPNPQDSYAEILRLSGNFQGALEHYRAALKIDPKFVSSQLGIADTYTLMGDQERARAEYATAIRDAETEADSLDYSLQAAATWVRANHHEDADKAFAAVAENAHSVGLDLHEARAHRQMAMYQADDASALKHLEAAETTLDHQANLAQSDREEERAQILRYRAVRAAHAGNQELADKTLHQLEAMANGSRSAIIQSSYHAAAGALLMAGQKYADAIPHLEEDRLNPFSLQLLSRAYSETGKSEEMHIAEAHLRSTNLPTLEQALVVPAARATPPANP